MGATPEHGKDATCWDLIGGGGRRGVLTQPKIRYDFPPAASSSASTSEFLTISSNNKKPSKTSRFQGLDLVAGTGFEPVTFRL